MNEFKFEDVLAMIEREAIAQGEDPKLARAIAIAENTGSGVVSPGQMYRIGTKSPKGATGVGQVMPATMQGLVKQGFVGTPTGNPLLDEVRAMVGAIKEKRRYAGDDPLKMAIAYNAGPKWLENFDGDISKLPAETQGYIGKMAKQLKLNVSTKDVPDFMKGTALAAANSFLTRSRELTPLMQAITGDMLADGEAAKAAADQEAEAKAAGIRAEAAGKKAQVEQRESVLQFYGLDRANPNAALVQAMGVMASAQEATRNMAPVLAELKSKSFMDDPIEWVKAQFQLQGMVGKYNAAATQYNNASQQIGSLQQKAAAQISIEPGATAAGLDAQAAAEAEAAYATAKFKKYAIAKDQRVAQMSAISTEMQHLNMEFSHAAALQRFMQEKFEFDERMEGKDREKVQLAQVNQWLARSGASAITPEQFKTMDVKTRTEYLKKSNGVKFAIDDTPGDSLNTLHDLAAVENFKAQLKNEWGPSFVDKFTFQAAKAAEQLKLGPNGSKMKDEEAFVKAANGIYKKWRDELSTRQYDKLSPDNPWKMNAAIFSTSPALKNNSLAQYAASTPNAGAGLREADILTFAVAQVAKGKPTREVANEVKQFFTEGSKFQHSQLGLGLLGFDLRGSKGYVEYPIDGDVFGFFQRIQDPRKVNSSKVDLQLFNETSIENFLVLSVAASKRQEALQGSKLDLASRLSAMPLAK